jgi:hypothetical protein
MGVDYTFILQELKDDKWIDVEDDPLDLDVCKMLPDRNLEDYEAFTKVLKTGIERVLMTVNTARKYEPEDIEEKYVIVLDKDTLNRYKDDLEKLLREALYSFYEFDCVAKLLMLCRAFELMEIYGGCKYRMLIFGD